MRPVQNGQGHGYGVDQVAGCDSSLGRRMLSLARNLRRESLVGEVRGMPRFLPVLNSGRVRRGDRGRSGRGWPGWSNSAPLDEIVVVTGDGSSPRNGEGARSGGAPSLDLTHPLSPGLYPESRSPSCFPELSEPVASGPRGSSP